MNAVTIQLEKDLAALLYNLNQPIQRTARELMVLELYRRGSISSGKAAQLLDMPRFGFIQYASRLGIAFFDMTEDNGQPNVHKLKRYNDGPSDLKLKPTNWVRADWTGGETTQAPAYGTPKPRRTHSTRFSYLATVVRTKPR